MNRPDQEGASRRTRFAIDAVTALRLVREDPGAGAHLPLVAPAALRSHAMSILYRDADAGLLDEKTARLWRPVSRPAGTVTDRGARRSGGQE